MLNELVHARAQVRACSSGRRCLRELRLRLGALLPSLWAQQEISRRVIALLEALRTPAG